MDSKVIETANIYDFDDTIYKGDTFIDLLKYSFLRHPFLLLNSIFKTIPLYFKYKKNSIPFERVKETLLSFLFKINNKDKYIKKFINSKKENIKTWYINNQKENDIIISASYEIWIKPFCNEIGIKNVIATKTDNIGNIIGKNCKREEKVRRLNEEFPNIVIDESYSDSQTDIPMLEVAKKAFVVEDDILVPYDKNYNFIMKR